MRLRRAPLPPAALADPEAVAAAARAELAAERYRAKLAAERDAAERDRLAAAELAERERRQAATDRRRAARAALTARLRPVLPLLVVNAATVYAQGAYAFTEVAPESWPTAGRLALALTFAAALESVALYVQWHAHDALLRQAHGTAARLRRGAYLIAAAIGLINLSHWWESAPAAGIGFALLSLLSPFLWGLHTRRLHNVQLLATDRARIDDCGVEFSARRRRAFPWRTWQASRWAIDHGVTEPAAAWAGYNAERAERRAARLAERQAPTAAEPAAELAAAEPVSGAPVDLAAASKTAAVHYAHTALGQVPAARVVAYLADHGVTVSESQVYKVRRQVGAEPAAELAAAEPAPVPVSPAPPARRRRPAATAAAAPPAPTAPPRRLTRVNGAPYASATPAE
jgi:hypothetical protein